MSRMRADDQVGRIATMIDPLLEDYLRWLEPQIRDQYGHPDRTYWDLVGCMFHKDFVWLIPNDDNRVGDGIELRREFEHTRDLQLGTLDNHLNPETASFLEVLIGLSRRLEFMAGGDAAMWAWQFLNNLELHRMTDPLPRRKLRQVDRILDVVIWRTYEPNGNGGFFPLMGSETDMTRIELWYQMAAFIDEIHPEHRG